MLCLSAWEAAAYFCLVCKSTKYSAFRPCCLLHPQAPTEDQQEPKAAVKWGPQA